MGVLAPALRLLPTNTGPRPSLGSRPMLTTVLLSLVTMLPSASTILTTSGWLALSRIPDPAVTAATPLTHAPRVRLANCRLYAGPGSTLMVGFSVPRDRFRNSKFMVSGWEGAPFSPRPAIDRSSKVATLYILPLINVGTTGTVRV